ncbi:MAG: hypothetical protein E7317_03145 [Clostridiales bacterium]|nr:hypothetical protein [Clostridiales bacterium]
MTLIELYEAEQERLSAALLRDRSVPAAMEAVDRMLGRMEMRYVGEYPDAALREHAQLQLAALRSAVPFIDAVAETRTWRRDVAAAAAGKPRMGVASVAMLAGGALLVLGSLISLDARSPVAMVIALALGAAGCALCFFGGRAASKSAATPAQDDTPVRTEALVDVEKLMHALRGMLLSADGRLEAAGRARRDEAPEARARAFSDMPATQLTEDPIELLSELLETAYALRGGEYDGDAREMISGIRFYLHGQGIETEDYTEEHRAWFERLPMAGGGTMRPALVKDGKPVRKGLAGQ